ncbi:hypothetical protein EYZ11_010316 [Aspergillus tanneri]|uniref:Uncharacterized protein n=1 Tax=Aspergillus tanneri TaxID=1220188 RepID=A0A4S3J5L5_9EURO|nr:uncharacterized protein ATNIH1004_010699 [Aspergillus tanneri]KAA8641760.1 hypothetical protein ATNIH1004_010699 [Aspergillus tanneri]THC90216.1 hypothetical protein EYZ11_010316 [Aspergillus tanneri]
MDHSYTAIEKRVSEAVKSVQGEKKPKIAELARVFNVPYDGLRRSFQGGPSRSDLGVIVQWYNVLELYIQDISREISTTLTKSAFKLDKEKLKKLSLPVAKKPQDLNLKRLENHSPLSSVSLPMAGQYCRSSSLKDSAISSGDFNPHFQTGL